MDLQSTIEQAKSKLNAATGYFTDDIKTLRTGRASAAMLDSVVLTAYGQPMKLIQLATVTAPEAQMLQITPFDPSTIQAIVSSIRDNPNLGLNPSDDGRVVRIPVPALTEDRRRELVKQLGGKQEDAMVRVRGIRHDFLDQVDKAKKDKSIGEDEAKRYAATLEEATNKVKAEVEAIARAKESEIMTL